MTDWQEWLNSRHKYASRDDWYDARPEPEVIPVEAYPERMQKVLRGKK